MVFQNYALYPHMSVFDNMAYGLRIRGLAKADIAERVKRAADILELEPLLARTPRQLSGGQRQRVAMGRAIVREPAVFLFDEPLSNLDAKLRVQMRFEIQKLHRRLSTTSLYVTHDQVEAMTLAQRMIVMNAGRAEQIGTPMEVYENPQTIFVAGFIGSPAMNFVAGKANGDGRIALDHGGEARTSRATLAQGRAVTVGIRPEHLVPCGERDALLSGPVEMVENLGAERWSTSGTAAATSSRALPHGASPAVGSTFCVGADPARVFVFDAADRRAAALTIMCGLPAWPYPKLCAHRGAGKLAPENTLAAFRARLRARLPDGRVRRQAVGRRRRVPAARRHARPHDESHAAAPTR